MRFNVACTAVLSAAGIASAFPGFFDKSQDVVTADDKPAVPGDNPLIFCNAQHGDDIIEITNVDLVPNPPQAGKPLVIRATGTVFEPIVEGAYINIVVKYGLIKLLSTELDLCEQTEKADLNCPIEKGALTVEKTVELPGSVPPGKYTVHAEVVNGDDDESPITCLEATVVFGSSVFENEL